MIAPRPDGLRRWCWCLFPILLLVLLTPLLLLSSGYGQNDALPGAVPPIQHTDPVHARPHSTFLSSIRLPSRLTFAGQEAPLENWQVRERIEYEFYQFLDDQGESIILAKRSGRCFPVIERQLAEAHLPDDLKYVVLLQSKCLVQPAFVSSRSGRSHHTARRRTIGSLAAPDWQVVATQTIQTLQDLHHRLGDWWLVLAAYKVGLSEIRERLQVQHVHDYWRGALPPDAMVFVPRIVAAKEVFSQPAAYLGLTPEDLYTPVKTEIVTVQISEAKRPLTKIAEEYGSYLLELKLLNPELKANFLTKGTHRLRVPKLSETDAGAPLLGSENAGAPQ